MGKRKRVPVSIHSELTQYSSLLRSLRTANTADLSSHLLPSHLSKRFGTSDDSDLNERTGDESVDHPSEVDTSRPPTPFGSEFDSGSTPASPTTIARARWTKWPLLSGDIVIPEFSLEQEIRQIASQSLRLFDPSYVSEKNEDKLHNPSRKPKHSPSQELTTPPEQVSPANDSRLMMTEPEEDVSPYLVRALCDGTTKHLSDILGLVAAFQPDVGISMQDRLKPVDWQDLLNIISTCGVVDSRIVDHVRARMNALYMQHGPEGALLLQFLLLQLLTP